jgi:hypothetical protein
MSSRDINKRLSSENSQTSVNGDVIKKVELTSKQRLLPSGEINHVVDVGEQFDKERQSGTKYRITSTIKPIMSNVLFNMAGNKLYGNAGWTVFDNDKFKKDPFFNVYTGKDTLTFKQSYRKHLKEVDGWFGYFDPDVNNGRTCEFYDLEPKRERLLFDELNNWTFTLTYPASTVTTHTLVNGGLLIIGKEEVEISNRPMVALSTFVKHGLSMGDTVRITNMGYNLDGDYTVIRTGLDDGTHKEYYFVLDIDPTVLPSIGSNTRMKRVFGGQESTYYFRKFKKINTSEGQPIKNGDYELHRLHLANTIYNDPNYQLIFNPEIDVDGLVDNLGRPLSEIYITLIKRKNGFFSDIKSGLESALVEGVKSNTNLPDIRQIYNANGSKPAIEGNVLRSADEFYGDVVEYNKYEVKETILSEVRHRFNTINRDGDGNQFAAGPRLEGYFYKPHYQIKIRQFSNYIEQGDENTQGIPDYAEDLGDGRFLWRDLLDIGFDDGQGDIIDYPFLNGKHYIYNDMIVALKRQDPFANYNLYYNGDLPRDIIGGTIDGDFFNVNNSDDVC